MNREHDEQGQRQKPVSSARPTRKQFLQGSAALATLALTPGLVTACGDGQGNDSGRRKGRLTAAFVGGGADETLDPHEPVEWLDAARGKALFDRLVENRADMSIEKRLAESLKPNADATEWRITLREGVEFHNGKPLLAQDVLYSIERVMNSEVATTAASALEPLDISRSRIEDDRNLVLTLDRPVSEFPNALAAWGVLMVPDGTDDFSEPVGTGPFRFQSFEPGTGSVFARNDDYWDGAPEIEELELITMEDETARMNALLGGDVDYADELGSATVRSLEGDDRAKIVRLDNSSVQGFVMKLDRPPFDDPRVRRAFQLLVDRRQLLENVFGGYGQVGNDLFGKGSQYYHSELPQRSRDVERARSLLEEAGAEGLSVGLLTTESQTGFVEAATLFSEQAKEAGVEINIEQLDGADFWERTLEDGAISNWRSGAMPIETRYAGNYLSDSESNYSHWQRPRFDELYSEMQSTTEEDEKRSYYQEMQQMLWEEGGDIIWGFTDWIIGISPGLEGISEAPQNTFEWANFKDARFV